MTKSFRAIHCIQPLYQQHTMPSVFKAAEKQNKGKKRAAEEEPQTQQVEKKRKDKVLLLSSRGVTQRMRHLMMDLEALLPHTKKGGCWGCGMRGLDILLWAACSTIGMFNHSLTWYNTTNHRLQARLQVCPAPPERARRPAQLLECAVL